MKSKSRIQSHNSTVLDNVHCGLESAFVLVAGRNSSSNGWLRDTRVISISHEDRNLGAEFGQFERALSLVSYSHSFLSRYLLHATSVINEPAVAPAAPKQAAVANVG
jgi:hypothetical protein